MANRYWDIHDKANVYIMEIPPKEVKKKNISMQEIDDKVVALLEKNVRITKQSCITKKGIFSVDDKNATILDKIAKFKRNLAIAGKQEPKEDNIFFEMNYDFSEVKNIYNKIGGDQNNFPPYMQTPEAYEEYKKNHDILVIEDTKTNQPIGFMTRAIYSMGSADFKDMEEDAGKKIDKPILYYDSFAIDKSCVGKGIGRDVSVITDAYYLNIFGDKFNHMLVTGDINTAKGGKLSLKNHEDRGFIEINRFTKDTSSYKDRFKNYDGKGYGDLNLTTKDSYAKPVKRKLGAEIRKALQKTHS